ncbi:MAG: hypothetical protein V5A84_04630 [Planctomycetota bacterium]
MKRTTIYAGLSVLLLSAILLAGCGPGTDTGGEDGTAENRTQKEQAQGGQESEQGEGGSGYFGTINQARRSAKKTAALSKLQREVRRFKALKGRNPRSLDEFKQWRGGTLPEPPAGQQYSYNPETGKLTLTGSR